ncbi:hypothetical protein [Pseudobythopirellula maris]|uniref:hypothetical protein n=1 Tax=Pseudobythopirellula maris TaxID=2527991 RepID=UPI0011B5034E|nr:hypothetical protein [Pseudobythopirellula maris]
MRAIGLASLTYFGIVFAVGFVLGTVRTLWLVQALGERNAELLEAPVMIAVSFAAAGFVLERFSIDTIQSAATTGVVALMLLLAVEFSVVLGIRGLTVQEYFESRDPIAGGVYALSLLLFAGFPLVRRASISGRGA